MRRVLDIARLGDGLRVALHEHTDHAVVPRGYEVLEVIFDELDHIADDLQFLLSRANLVGEMGLAATEEVVRLAMLLFDALMPRTIKPLLRRGSGALTLRIDETLQHIPWELLHNGVEFLSRQYALSRELNVLGIGEPPPMRALPTDATRRVLIIADPRDDLPAAAREGGLLREAFDARGDIELGFMTGDVTKAELRESLREYDVLHFAGHAEWDDSGGGWLLADGRFEPRDVARLEGTRAMPALVFANACSSGAAARPVADGVAGALLRAGVRACIGTLWDIPDDIGILFAAALYRRLLNGESIGEAVRTTRIELAEKFGDGTVLWGSYVLYGDPEQRLFAPRTLAPMRDLTEEAMPGRKLIKPSPRSPIAPNPMLRSSAAEAADRSPLQEQMLRMQRAAIVAIAACILAIVALSLVFYSSTETAGGSGAVADSEPPAEAGSGHGELVLPESQVESGSGHTASTLRVELGLVAQLRDAQGHLRDVPLNPGDMLHTNDRVRLAFEANQDAYAYVFFVDGRSRAQVLFPNVDGDVGEVSGGLPVALPQADDWYWLDDVPGTNAFIVAVSDEPIDSLPLLVHDIRELLQESEPPTSVAPVEDPGLAVVGEEASPRGVASETAGLRTLPLALVRERIGREAPVVEVFEIDHRP